MNRSILIVICDFLLLSLLTFSTDINHMADENTQPPTKVAVATNAPASSGADLSAAMKLALEEEKHTREQLQQQFEQSRGASSQQQAQLSQQQAQLSQQQSQLSQREQENARLQAQYAAAQTNLATLGQQLQSTSARAQESQAQLAARQAEVQRESALAASLQQQVDFLSQSNHQALTDKQQLAAQLQLAEAEQRAAAQRADLLQQEARTAQAENARLAESIKMLATNSSQLKQEIHDNQPLTLNSIFSDIVSNRVSIQITARRTGVFGRDIASDKTTQSILIAAGNNYYVLSHVRSTPLTEWDPGTDWDRLTGTLAGRAGKVPIHALNFNAEDPRVVLVPVSQADALRLGVKIYHLSSEPYKFQDAVLVGANEDYYGECNFQIELSTPHYVRLDHSLLNGLFGKFNPSRGDLVLSRHGELLGVMVNNTHCLTLDNFTAAAAFPFDADLRNQRTGPILSELGDHNFELPANLQ